MTEEISQVKIKSTRATEQPRLHMHMVDLQAPPPPRFQRWQVCCTTNLRHFRGSDDLVAARNFYLWHNIEIGGAGGPARSVRCHHTVRTCNNSSVNSSVSTCRALSLSHVGTRIRRTSSCWPRSAATCQAACLPRPSGGTWGRGRGNLGRKLMSSICHRGKFPQ